MFSALSSEDVSDSDNMWNEFVDSYDCSWSLMKNESVKVSSLHDGHSNTRICIVSKRL
jgi:hypothetical protein